MCVYVYVCLCARVSVHTSSTAIKAGLTTYILLLCGLLFHLNCHDLISTSLALFLQCIFNSCILFYHMDILELIEMVLCYLTLGNPQIFV